MPRKWIVLRVQVASEFQEAIGNFLIESGAPGLQIEDAGCQKVLTAHFLDAPPLGDLERFCADLGCPSGAGGVSIGVDQLAEENWAENWKLNFRPLLVGERLAVCPPWEATRYPERITVVIDPGMAFGTGHHATTRSCLELIAATCAAREIDRALDLGTGSGILAIALAKLGVRKTLAVDIDPIAREAARTNAAANNVAERVKISAALEYTSGMLDLIVANLFANLLLTLAPVLARQLRVGGVLILSGLLQGDESAVRSAYDDTGLALKRRIAENEWVTLLFMHP